MKASKIAEFLNAELFGPDIEVNQPCPLDGSVPGGICFSRDYTAEQLDSLCLNGVLLLSERRFNVENLCHIAVENTRLAFARVLTRFFSEGSSGISDKAIIAERVTIGSDSVVKPGAIIGHDGFGFENDEFGIPIRIPHIGGVVIGVGVEIGSGTVIARGTLTNTVIGNHVKIDDKVFIAHNVRIGARTKIVAGAVVCGSASIGEDCWVGPSSCIKDHVDIGNGALVGIGAIVLKDVLPNAVVIGNPARFLRWRNE